MSCTGVVVSLTRVMDCIGGKHIKPAALQSLEKLTAALYESMRFKPVGPVSIRQATKDFSLPPMKACPMGLSIKKK